MISNFFGIKEFSNQTIEELHNKRLALTTFNKKNKIIIIPKFLSLFFMTDLHQISQIIINKIDPIRINLETLNCFKTLNGLFKKKKIRLLNKMNPLITKIIKLSPNPKDFYNSPIPKYESLEELRTRLKKMRVLEKIKIIIQEKFRSWSSIFSSEQKINLYAKQFEKIKIELNKIDENLTRFVRYFSHSFDPLDQKMIETINDINKELKKAIPYTRIKYSLFL